MDIFIELKTEFGTLYKLAMLLGIRETAIYQWKPRKIPIKHIRKIEELSEGESQQLGKLVQFYDHDTQLSWKPTYKHRVLLLYREDFMREMLGFFSWVDLKVRLWGYRTFKSVRQWFSCQSE